MPTCKVHGCGRPVVGHGWCNVHYQRWLRLGDANATVNRKISTEQIVAHFSKILMRRNKTDCAIWPWRRKDGYCERITVNGRREMVHRAVCRAVHGEPPSPNMEAIHSCGNGHGGCVNPWHLDWGTHAENMSDMIVHETSTRGSSNPMSKLTESEAREILRRIKTEKGYALAKEFKVSEATVSAIKKRKRWYWL